MHLVAIAWMYVVVAMSIAEALSPAGTLLGAAFTFLLYGALPLSIVLYLLGTPGRRRRRAAAAAALHDATAPVADDAAAPRGAPSADRGGQAAQDLGTAGRRAGAAVAAVRSAAARQRRRAAPQPRLRRAGSCAALRRARQPGRPAIQTAAAMRPVTPSRRYE